MIRIFYLSLVASLFVVGSWSCKKPKPIEPNGSGTEFVDTIDRSESFLLTFKNMGNGQPLVLQSSLDSGSTLYTTFNEAFRVKSFMYYVSNIKLISESGQKIPIYPTYNLIDASKGDFQQRFTIPNERFTAIEFLIGVDSIRNVSGIQDGALDPLLGMFWEWNTGYIMAKIDAESEEAEYGVANYHAGGFKGEFNVLRTVRLELNDDLFPQGQERNLVIYAEILKWFDGDMKISIKEKPTINLMGAEASKLADNYKYMFVNNELR